MCHGDVTDLKVLEEYEEMEQAKLLEGIKVLMRGHWELPPDISADEFDQCARKIIKEVRTGDNINVIEFRLSQMQTNLLQQPYTKDATRKLAESAVAWVRNSN